MMKKLRVLCFTYHYLDIGHFMTNDQVIRMSVYRFVETLCKMNIIENIENSDGISDCFYYDLLEYWWRDEYR